MKKFVITFICATLLTGTAWAKCDGGSEITSQYGHTFCLSSKEMTWWSGFSWCAANNRPFALSNQICPDTKGGYSCRNDTMFNSFSNNEYIWTATPQAESSALSISHGNTIYASVTAIPRGQTRRVICY